MSDRTYASFTIPLSVIADSANAEAVRRILEMSTDDFHSVILASPLSEAASGIDGCAVRLVDNRPCLVYEDTDADYGGTTIESELVAAAIPFIQRHGAGHEYGPASIVFTGTRSESIRLDHDLAAVVGIGIINGRTVVDPGEIADVERYEQLRTAVLLYPATSAAA